MDKTDKINKYINILKYLLINVVSTIPICIYIITLNNIDRSYIFPIFLNIHIFVSFYLFCFSVIFHINNFDKKVILMTFLSFLLVSLIAVFSNIYFNYVYMPPTNTPDFQILLNRAIFFNIIFFIILMLSYNSFNAVNTDKISDFFTVFGDTFLWFLIINTASSTILSILIYAFLIVGFSIVALFSASTEIGFLIAKFVICVFIFIYGFIPFLSYHIYIKTKSVISIYVSRALLVFNLFAMFIMMFFFLPYESRPYNNRIVYMIYNILLAFIIMGLMFTRMEKKSNIFIKAMYLLTPFFGVIFNLLTITATIYRIANFGLTPNKLTLIILNIIFLVHLVLIFVNSILSFIASFRNRTDNTTLNVIVNNKPILFIYVYFLFSLFVCFVLPIIYIK
ncbi:hypothetical protein R4K55_03295 [Brachyspira alvinipulli]|uniref:hypothetical protein n=1 Tax=Brachyspira alvinipulli TaxID=84379 RepID=UPI0030052349